MDAKKTTPFAWACPDCRQKTVAPVQWEYSLTAVRDGEPCEVALHGVLVPTCGRCGGSIITSELSLHIEAGLQRLVELRASKVSKLCLRSLEEP